MNFLRCFRHYWQAEPTMLRCLAFWGSLAFLGHVLIAVACVLWVKP